MSRFSTSEQVWAWALKAAAGDRQKHLEFNVDLNPFSTNGARNAWQRGFDNAPPRSWEGTTLAFDTIYQRGRAAAEIAAKDKDHESP